MFKTVPKVLPALLRRMAVTAFALSSVFFASAQYCTPTVSSAGLYINQIKFDYSASIVGGIGYLTGNGGYTQTVSSSSGTIKRYWGSGIWYNIQNSSGVLKSYRIKLFADWNNDGDFNDFMEDNSSNGGTIDPATNLGTGLTITPPLSASGTIRIRIAMCEGTTYPMPCGSFTGEVEDYILTIGSNTAPVLDNSGTPFINEMLVSQTNAEGFSLNQLIASSGPDVNMANDGDDISSNQMVPRGLAIYGQSAANGTWEYKMGNGAWTGIGAVSSSNALLLLGDGNINYQLGMRIRFVPSSAGTASISFLLWDGTSGTNGGYANIVSTGGTTAFSNNTEIASVNVASTLGTSGAFFLSTQQNIIYNTAINRSTGKMQDPKNLFGATHDNYYSGDITLDAAGAKLYWISGASQDRISSSNVDGSNLQTSLITGLGYGGTGIAVSGSKIFYMDWTPGIFSTSLDGSNRTALTGGAGQLDPNDIWDIADIEYANNKIYFLYYSGASNTYRLMSANTDGTSPTEIYSSTNYMRGLYITATQAYWTEQDPVASPALSYVKKRSLSGGSVTTLATETGRLFYDLMADEANSLIYFITADGSNASELRRVSTTGGTVSIVLSLNGTVNSLAFDVAGTTLPVTLVRYDAKLLSDMTAELSWTTSNETNCSHFIIEKSNDAVNFTPFATVQAKGNSSASYSFIDTKVSNGVTYYRLKEEGFDGKTKDLGIRRIKIATPSLLDAYPNPLTGTSLTVNTGYEFTGTIAYTMFDAAGRTVLTGTLKQQQQTIETGKLPAGYYVLSLADGQRLQLTKN